MFMLIFWNVCVIATGLYAAIYGQATERVGAAAVIIGSYASIPSAAFFGAPEIGILVIDCMLLAVFVWLMIVTDRFWPIWATGFHMISVVTHIAVAVQPKIIPVAYATYAIFWGYPVLAALAWGTWDQKFRATKINVSPS
jgi:hypothetical protein